jgi:hypothetical protein
MICWLACLCVKENVSFDKRSLPSTSTKAEMNPVQLNKTKRNPIHRLSLVIFSYILSCVFVFKGISFCTAAAAVSIFDVEKDGMMMMKLMRDTWQTSSYCSQLFKVIFISEIERYKIS